MATLEELLGEVPAATVRGNAAQALGEEEAARYLRSLTESLEALRQGPQWEVLRPLLMNAADNASPVFANEVRAALETYGAAVPAVQQEIAYNHSVLALRDSGYRGAIPGNAGELAHLEGVMERLSADAGRHTTLEEYWNRLSQVPGFEGGGPTNSTAQLLKNAGTAQELETGAGAFSRTIDAGFTQLNDRLGDALRAFGHETQVGTHMSASGAVAAIKTFNAAVAMAEDPAAQAAIRGAIKEVVQDSEIPNVQKLRDVAGAVLNTVRECKEAGTLDNGSQLASQIRKAVGGVVEVRPLSVTGRALGGVAEGLREFHYTGASGGTDEAVNAVRGAAGRLGNTEKMIHDLPAAVDVKGVVGEAQGGIAAAAKAVREATTGEALAEAAKRYDDSVNALLQGVDGKLGEALARYGVSVSDIGNNRPAAIQTLQKIENAMMAVPEESADVVREAIRGAVREGMSDGVSDTKTLRKVGDAITKAIEAGINEEEVDAARIAGAVSDRIAEIKPSVAGAAKVAMVAEEAGNAEKVAAGISKAGNVARFAAGASKVLGPVAVVGAVAAVPLAQAQASELEGRLDRLKERGLVPDNPEFGKRYHELLGQFASWESNPSLVANIAGGYAVNAEIAKLCAEYGLSPEAAEALTPSSLITLAGAGVTRTQAEQMVANERHAGDAEAYFDALPVKVSDGMSPRMKRMVTLKGDVLKAQATLDRLEAAPAGDMPAMAGLSPARAAVEAAEQTFSGKYEQYLASGDLPMTMEMQARAAAQAVHDGNAGISQHAVEAQRVPPQLNEAVHARS